MTRKRSKKAERHRQTAKQQDGPDLVADLLTMVVTALVVIRWLVPTESAANGDTLWIVQLWLAAGLIWCWSCFRRRDFSVHLDRCDIALWILIGGQTVSALVLVMTQGDKRAAVNMIWEWIGLGVLFFLLRQTIITRQIRQRFLLSVVAVVVVLSSLGFWQHYVWYPQAVKAYDEVRAELDQLQSSTSTDQRATARERQNRRRELTRQLLDSGVPAHALEGRSRKLFEQRLRASTEPFGMFALANTLAGLLACGLIVALGFVWAGDRRSFSIQWLASAVVVLVVAYVLLLTKSRTAWVGLLAGFCFWAWSRFGSESIKSRRLLFWIATPLLLLGVLFAVAGLSGGFDRAVLSEAPKSLKYRFEYWAGTWGVIREQPLLGTGPGNFRQHYLQHKLAQSSEEISDPHNFILDVWANGGLLSLAGLLAVLFTGAKAYRARIRVETLSDKPNEVDEQNDGPVKKQRREENRTRLEAGLLDQQTVSVWAALANPISLGSAAAFLVTFAFGFVFRHEVDTRLFWMLAGWLITMTVLSRIWANRHVGDHALAAAVIALLVHLLGAGGIAMPAISQTLLVLLAVVTIQPPQRQTVRQTSPAATRKVIAIGGTSLMLFFLCLISATAPVLNRQASIRAGDSARSQMLALRYYVEASEFDPLSSEPPHRLAALVYQRWLVSASPTPADFKQVVELSELAIEKDPSASTGYWELGHRYLSKFEKTREPEDARAASKSFLRAVELNPTDVMLRAELAIALDKAGQEFKLQSQQQVEEAFRLDKINRAAGHVDKYLSDELVGKLQVITNDYEGNSRKDR